MWAKKRGIGTEENTLRHVIAPIALDVVSLKTRGGERVERGKKRSVVPMKSREEERGKRQSIVLKKSKRGKKP